MTVSVSSSSAGGFAPLIMATAANTARWLAEETATASGNNNETTTTHDEEDGGGHSEFGVHITYEDLYDAILFLVVIYVSGQIASRLLQMPSLVGEIVAGILLGPELADIVPFPEAWVLFGEIGYVCNKEYIILLKRSHRV